MSQMFVKPFKSQLQVYNVKRGTQKTDLIRILSNLSRLVRVVLIRIDFDEPHCEACLGWFHKTAAMFEYFIQAYKALFGPSIRSPTTKEMGERVRRVRRGGESLGFELFALWF